MRLLKWNVRGCNAPEKRCLIKRGINQAQLDLMFFQESKLSGNCCASFANKFGAWGSLFVEDNGAFGGLGILWKEALVIVSLVDFGTN